MTCCEHTLSHMREITHAPTQKIWEVERCSNSQCLSP